MNNSLEKFFKKINKFEYRIVFLTIYIVGVIILYLASLATKDNQNPWMMLVLSVGLMVIYGIYAYSFRGNENVNQIADSAYFLGFLFALFSRKFIRNPFSKRPFCSIFFISYFSHVFFKTLFKKNF